MEPENIEPENIETNQSTFKDLIDQEKEERFTKPWSKLDKGTKLNRIHLFIKKQKIENFLDDPQEKQLKILLLNLFETSRLNKISDIDYSTELKEIISIKNLIFNEETKEYSYNNLVKNKKTDSKSKSNIDRHFNRSKKNN